MRIFSLINLAVFQLCWFISATYQDAGIAVILALMIVHYSISPSKLLDLKILPVALTGIVVDQLLITVGVINIPQSTSLIMPIWLMLLWCVLAWSFNHSLQWLTGLNLYKVSVLGAIFGTLSYYTAIQFDAIGSDYSTSYFVLIMMGVWALLLPFLVRLYRVIVTPPNQD